MTHGLYYPGTSMVHRLGAGWKLFLLVVSAPLLFLTTQPLAMLAALLLVIALYFAARLPGRVLWLQLRALLPVMLLIGLTQLYWAGPSVTAAVVLRLCALLLAASLVTLTTRVSDMVDTLDWALQPLKFMLNPAKVSLAISLAIRFIPILSAIFSEVREAQKARGLERNILALAVPLILRILKMTDEIADAIDARS
ncbi:energy-coupling factor transporter transmembrane protein EcfT [Aureimonas fodinaquatilis]|uniref:Energy-coupling factor transporter transmembrane protein EcfT n=1 Tax=Aureimonas fodinaquatilis TaxID=2565783 RepID=A0A5B0DWZ3_9HYPH|nr:energy-coupling factor transporter transmembrane protein EcfT [Aureimonas fodinaquatilis]KAA0971016.1 energy-coupling factor transporter transmembrane protein EcfT [Aureimonas fodinaquatilis]